MPTDDVSEWEGEIRALAAAKAELKALLWRDMERLLLPVLNWLARILDRRR